MKLSFEEDLRLTDLIYSDAWPVVIKVIKSLAENQKEAVLKYSLHDGPEGLIITKARYEGAQALVDKVSRFKADLEKRKRLEE
jgi:hypothetical protein